VPPTTKQATTRILLETCWQQKFPDAQRTQGRRHETVRGPIPAASPVRSHRQSDKYKEFDRIVSLVVRLRGTVERDRRTREIEAIPGAEGPARIGLCLERLLAGLTALGLKRKTAFKVITTIAMDSTPPLRRQAYEYLCAHTDAFGPIKAETPKIAEALLLPTITVRRALEDLAAYHLVKRIKGGKGQPDAWVATPPK